MRIIKAFWTGLGVTGLMLAAWLSAVGGAAAQSDSAAGGPAGTANIACGFTLSEAVYSAWQGLGAKDGRLGCPTAKESASSTSSQGSASRVAVFGLNGEIVLHVSGPRAGQAIPVTGCFYRLYTQFGGPSGWLGLPTADADNTPDGSRQTFEGGFMRYARALDSCEATPVAPSPSPPAPAAAAAQSLAPLDVFEDPATGDRLSLASKANVDDALAAGYQRLRGQARVLTLAAPGATALKLFFNEARNLRETLATAQSEREALASGYAFEGGQGFVWTDPRQGAVPLKLYRNPDSGRARLTAGAQDEAEATAKGYVFVRIEGYAAP